MSLIKRETLLAAYDAAHKGPPGGARKLIEEAPEVEAITVEWLKAQNTSTEYYKTVQGQAVELVLELWQKEQEAR